MRRALLLFLMFAGFALIVWSGWQNIRQRRRAIEAQQENRVDLIPDAQNAAPGDAPAADSPLRGKPAPAFTLSDLDGKKVSLSDYKGHPLLINYWATYCAPCKVEMPWLQELSQKYAASGFQVIGIDYDSEVGKDTIARNAKQLGVTYPVLLSDSKVETAYLDGSDYLPMSFYVDKLGKVIQVSVGLGSKDQLESLVKQTIAAGVKE